MKLIAKSKSGSAAAKRAWVTIRANKKREAIKWILAGKKAWATRRANELTRIAKKAWATRRRNGNA